MNHSAPTGASGAGPGSPAELAEALTEPVYDEYGSFAGDFDDEDWSHALGGVHVLARRDGELVGHAHARFSRAHVWGCSSWPMAAMS